MATRISRHLSSSFIGRKQTTFLNEFKAGHRQGELAVVR